MAIKMVMDSLQKLYLVLEISKLLFLFVVSFSPYNLENWCKNALDLNIGMLTVESNLPIGTYCQWLISAVDDKHYVNLEFEILNVRIANTNCILDM